MPRSFQFLPVALRRRFLKRAAVHRPTASGRTEQTSPRGLVGSHKGDAESAFVSALALEGTLLIGELGLLSSDRSLFVCARSS